MSYSPDEHAFLNVADSLRRREQTLQGLVEQYAELRAERDAYLKHLESSQETVRQLTERIRELEKKNDPGSPADAGPAGVRTPTAEPLSECGEAGESTSEATNSTP
jgi:hypothetical protein